MIYVIAVVALVVIIALAQSYDLPNWATRVFAALLVFAFAAICLFPFAMLVILGYDALK